LMGAGSATLPAGGFFLVLLLALALRWMLKRVQHDE
jgi:hypothetical protein